MSQIFDVQESLKTELEGLSKMANCTVIVDRQHDLDTEAKKAVAKSKGFACIIGAPRGTNVETEAPGPQVRYEIALLFVFKPIMSDTATDKFDDVLEQVIKHCHLLEVSGGRKHMCEDFKYLNHFLVEDSPSHLSYIITLETIRQL